MENLAGKEGKDLRRKSDGVGNGGSTGKKVNSL